MSQITIIIKSSGGWNNKYCVHISVLLQNSYSNIVFVIHRGCQGAGSEKHTY